MEEQPKTRRRQSISAVLFLSIATEFQCLIMPMSAWKTSLSNTYGAHECAQRWKYRTSAHQAKIPIEHRKQTNNDKLKANHIICRIHFDNDTLPITHTPQLKAETNKILETRSNPLKLLIHLLYKHSTHHKKIPIEHRKQTNYEKPKQATNFVEIILIKKTEKALPIKHKPQFNTENKQNTRNPKQPITKIPKLNIENKQKKWETKSNPSKFSICFEETDNTHHA